MSDFTDVGDFHRKFGLAHVDSAHGKEPCDEGAPGPRPVDEDLINFRLGFLEEELREFEEGVEEGNHAKVFDSLIDLVYVALGTAHLLGYPWQEGWNLVQAANMKKQRAAADGSDSKRGSPFDVVKPPGWVPPDIDLLLFGHGFGPLVFVCPGCKRESGECYRIHESLRGDGVEIRKVTVGYYCERSGMVQLSS